MLILQRNIISENDISKAHELSVIALKGQNIIAQGNALGKETSEISKPCKGDIIHLYQNSYSMEIYNHLVLCCSTKRIGCFK